MLTITKSTSQPENDMALPKGVLCRGAQTLRATSECPTKVGMSNTIPSMTPREKWSLIPETNLPARTILGKRVYNEMTDALPLFSWGKSLSL
jgi:hypothetical protein